MSKQFIQNGIRNNDPDIVLIENPNAKSDVWRTFTLIEFIKVSVDFVCCRKCKTILAYTKKHGTGTLLRHKCTLPAIAETCARQGTLDMFSNKLVPKRVLEDLVCKQLAFVAKDLNPLNISEGCGFRDYAQALVNIGAQYGMQKIEDLVISRKTLTTKVLVAEYNKLKAELILDLADQTVSFTTDMWTDSHTQKSFVSLSSHYISTDFQLKVSLLGVKEFLDDKKTGDNIFKSVSEILYDFNLEDKLKNSVIVTDNGANVVNAFSHYKRLSCACHNLNLVMNDVFKKHPVLHVKILIDSSKKLVKFFKYSELNNKLSKTLKQDIKTRWNSIYIMLNSINEVKQEIKNILLKKDELHRISDIDFNLLEKLLLFLKPLKECSEELSSDKEPTIHIFTLWSEKLIKHCSTSTFDSEVITEFKCATLNSLKKRFMSTTVHLVGVFLNPPFKKLNFLSDEQKQHVLNTVKSMALEFFEGDKYYAISENVALNTGEQKFGEFLDDNFRKKIKKERSLIDVEIEKYYNSSLAPGQSVLELWQNAKEMDLLRTLAKAVLAIPVSSATSERIFSTSGIILNERRTRLLSSNLDKIIFLYKNM